MKIDWDASYKIGHVEIDEQHQELFSLINEFLAATAKPELIACAMSMFKYTREHFTFEEAIMREIGYPSIKHHINQHNVLISRLNAIAEDIANDTLDKTHLSSFLSSWLVEHIGGSDTKLSTYIHLRKILAP